MGLIFVCGDLDNIIHKYSATFFSKYVIYKCYLLNKSNYMKRISLLNIFVFKIIEQTNLNNEYLRSPNHF